MARARTDVEASGGGHAGIGPVEFILFFPPAPERMVCGSTAGGLFVSKNGGMTWSKTGADTRIGRSGVISAALHPTDLRDLVRGIFGPEQQNYAQPIGLIGGIFRTTDEGTTRTQIVTASQLGAPETKIYKQLIDLLQGGRARLPLRRHRTGHASRSRRRRERAAAR